MSDYELSSDSILELKLRLSSHASKSQKDIELIREWLNGNIEEQAIGSSLVFTCGLIEMCRDAEISLRNVLPRIESLTPISRMLVFEALQAFSANALKTMGLSNILVQYAATGESATSHIAQLLLSRVSG